MNDTGEDEAVVRRLQALGGRPVEPALAQRVLERAHAGSVSWWRSTKAKVAAATAGGFLVGSIGLASAGTLPAPVQDAAHSAFGAVGIGVPPGHDRYNGPECGGTFANHGQYVKAHKDDPAAGASRCGKPSRAGAKGSTGDQADPEDADGQGPPPWAKAKGKGKAKGGPEGAGGQPGSPASPGATPDVTTTTTPTTTPPTTVPTTTTTTTTAAAPTTTTTTAAPTTTAVPDPPTTGPTTATTAASTTTGPTTTSTSGPVTTTTVP